MLFLLSYFGIAIASLVLLRAIYRITLHPLAKFPGPHLAAITSLYQAWYDLRPSTSYIKKFSALHEKYGKLDGRHSW